MTTASTACTPHSATLTWIFPGRIDRALVVNWRQAPMEALVHDLERARELEDVKDLTLIARLRLLSAECSAALARCRAKQDAVSAGGGALAAGSCSAA